MKKLFVFEGFLLISGVVFGIIGYFTIPDELIATLGEFLNGQMQNLAGVCSISEAALRIGRANVLELLRVYLTGICLLGVPILILLLFIKGFTFGFAGCFLVSHSFLLIITRFLCLPLFAAAAAIAIRFSWMMLQNRMQRPPGQLIEYTLAFLAMLVLVLAASLIDGFCCARYLAGFYA